MLTHGSTNGRTEIWTPILHPVIRKCDKKQVFMTKVIWFSDSTVPPVRQTERDDTWTESSGVCNSIIRSV